MNRIAEPTDVDLVPMTAANFDAARRLFDDPGLIQSWGGRRLSDVELRHKYLGGRSPAVEAFFVRDGGVDAGFIQHHRADDGGEGGGIDLVLLPEYRGNGVGTAAVLAMIGRLQGLGWQRITVDPDVANERGTAFWRRVGFSAVATIDATTERPAHRIMQWPPGIAPS